MTRDQTIKLFLECEAKRADGMRAEMSQDEAHEAAKAHWNSWAKGRIEERRELQGNWELLERKSETRSHWFRRHNAAMKSWLVRARADFSRCRIVLEGRTSETPSSIIASGMVLHGSAT